MLAFEFIFPNFSPIPISTAIPAIEETSIICNSKTLVYLVYPWLVYKLVGSDSSNKNGMNSVCFKINKKTVELRKTSLFGLFITSFELK